LQKKLNSIEIERLETKFDLAITELEQKLRSLEVSKELDWNSRSELRGRLWDNKNDLEAKMKLIQAVKRFEFFDDPSVLKKLESIDSLGSNAVLFEIERLHLRANDFEFKYKFTETLSAIVAKFFESTSFKMHQDFRTFKPCSTILRNPLETIDREIELEKYKWFIMLNHVGRAMIAYVPGGPGSGKTHFIEYLACEMSNIPTITGWKTDWSKHFTPVIIHFGGETKLEEDEKASQAFAVRMVWSYFALDPFGDGADGKFSDFKRMWIKTFGDRIEMNHAVAIISYHQLGIYADEIKAKFPNDPGMQFVGLSIEELSKRFKRNDDYPDQAGFSEKWLISIGLLIDGFESFGKGHVFFV
jgi:hypothetical protein